MNLFQSFSMLSDCRNHDTVKLNARGNSFTSRHLHQNYWHRNHKSMFYKQWVTVT